MKLLFRLQVSCHEEVALRNENSSLKWPFEGLIPLEISIFHYLIHHVVSSVTMKFKIEADNKFSCSLECGCGW